MRAMIVSLLIMAAASIPPSAAAQDGEQVGSIRGVKLGMGRDSALAALRAIFAGEAPKVRKFTEDGIPYTALSANGADFEMKISMTVLLSPRHEVVIGICYAERYTAHSAREPATIGKALDDKFGTPSERQLSGAFTWWKTSDGKPATDGCNDFGGYSVSPGGTDCYFQFRRSSTEACPIEVEANLKTSALVERWQLKMWHHNIWLTELKSYIEERERRRRTPPRL